MGHPVDSSLKRGTLPIYCSLLHVFHHGIMPLSLWFGTRWVGGGHASFAAMINAFVHTVMYTYYMVAALGPEYKVWCRGHRGSPSMTGYNV